MKKYLALLGLLTCSALAADTAPSPAQDCQLAIHHSAIEDKHAFRLEVSCRGTYNTLTYLLRAQRIRNGTTLVNSETSKLHIQGDSKQTGDVVLTLRPGDQVHVQARILQACEVFGETTLDYTHTPGR